MIERLIVLRRKQKRCARNLDSLGRAFPMDGTNSGVEAAALQTRCGVRELPAGPPAFVRRIHCRFPDANDAHGVPIRIKINGGRLSALLLSGALLLSLTANLAAGTLTGSFSPQAGGAGINLTALGGLDWVQWGLGGDYAVNRKAGVAPRISNFTLVASQGSQFSSPYWLEDTSRSYCLWVDGQPVSDITSNYTRVMAYAYPNLTGSGFRLTVTADTTTNILNVYVGTTDSKGSFKASLSDQPTNSAYSLQPPGTNINGVFTITFAADSPAQTLTVEWVVPGAHTIPPTFQTEGYVTLQAAALSAPGANNPPFAQLTSPANDATFPTPANIALNAFAGDLDGTVTNVSFYANSNYLGQSTISPYGFTWNNAPVGYHQLTAVATDDRGVSRASVPVGVFVHGTNGSQTGAVAFPPAAVDLTAEGTVDWVHWGLQSSTSVNRKAGVPAQISDVTPLGAANLSRYADNHSAYSWSDGSPTTATNGTTTGVFLTNLSSGFQLSVSVDETPRVLRLYVGAYAARGRLLAYLSDFSAQPYIDTSIYDASWDSEYAVYSIACSAASPGQQLHVVYRSQELLDGVWGNVTLQAATLSGGVVLLPVSIVDPVCTGPDFRFSFATQAGLEYVVQATATLSPPDWTNATTVPGTGGAVTVTNYNVPAGPQYYRVITQ